MSAFATKERATPFQLFNGGEVGDVMVDGVAVEGITDKGEGVAGGFEQAAAGKAEAAGGCVEVTGGANQTKQEGDGAVIGSGDGCKFEDHLAGEEDDLVEIVGGGDLGGGGKGPEEGAEGVRLGAGIEAVFEGVGVAGLAATPTGCRRGAGGEEFLILYF